MATKANRSNRRATSSNRRRTGQASEQSKRRTAGSTTRAAGNRGSTRATRSSRTRVRGTARNSKGRTIRGSDNGRSTSAERQRQPGVIREPITPQQRPEIREPNQELFERTTDYRQQKRVGLDPLASTVQKAHVWLKDLMDEVGTDDKHRAHLALRAVLHTLRDRLPVDEAVQLGAQLPTLIRGIYYEGWAPAGKPIKYNKQEFLNCVREYFMNLSGIDHTQIVQAVFRLLQKNISEGEIRNIQHSLPEEFAELWSEEAFATP